ncbi:MAG: hypothetical protein EBX61_03240 [Betaproteobacteria bacterium]|nr:hypothetical protein [Betaproteobacteria bacterium]NDF91407.1 hypothetical protein [Betaproteobacteria bacterium]
MEKSGLCLSNAGSPFAGRKLWVGASRMLEFLVYAFFTSKSHNQDGLSRRAQASRPRQLGAGKMAQAKRQER